MSDKKEIGQYGQARITDVKVGKKVSIEYEITHGDLIDTYSLCSADEPTPEFKNSLQELAGDVCDICEFMEHEKPLINVTGVSFSYNGEKGSMTMSASISATRRLKKTNTTMSLRTPSLPEAPKDQKKPDPFSKTFKLPASAATQIYIVINEARKYLNGIRAQTSITFPAEQEKK